MSITVSISGASLGELEQQFSQLMARLLGGQLQAEVPLATGGQVNATTTGNVPTVVSARLQQQVAELKNQSASTTGRTWQMVHAIADKFPEQYKLNDVRQQLAVPAGHVKAWRRNVGRWTKRTGVVIFEHVPGTHHPNEYRMPADVRQAVLNLGA